MLDTIKFEKVKKKYALNNSYFKNHQQNAPRNPFEILEYYKEYNELPFDNGSITSDWFYHCFVEYQKRAGVQNQQFFTPTKTAERLAELAYYNSDETNRVLDACCGFGQITMALKNKGFTQIEAFDIDKQMVDAFYDLTGVYARRYDFKNEENFANKYDLIVSNPPYDVKDLTEFLYFIDEHLNAFGKAVLLIPSGFLDKTRPARLVQILNKFYIESRETMAEKFMRTGTSAEIVVLSK